MEVDPASIARPGETPAAAASAGDDAAATGTHGHPHDRRHPVWANAHKVTAFLYVGGSLRSGDADPGTVLNELRGHGLTHILDCRTEASDETLVARLAPAVTYFRAGTQDEADGTAQGWFDSGVAFAREAFTHPGAVLLTHCALGQARGPSMAYAVLLDQGYGPGEALLMITRARPLARASYAEQALAWHLNRTGATAAQRTAAFELLRAARGGRAL